MNPLTLKVSNSCMRKPISSDSLKIFQQKAAKPILEANSSTSIPLTDNDFEILKNRPLLTSTIKPVNPNEKKYVQDTYKYHSYLNQHDARISSISEDDTNTVNSYLVGMAEMRYNRMKDFMNANKHLFARENKSILSKLFKAIDEVKQQIFIPGSF
ncbi:MAG: hypothetical protein MRZ90_00910 [Candidatus Gastranaerophilales bacterium]|nr:hypothetical protein [Candidatus Gastranaerophilales bacterium]